MASNLVRRMVVWSADGSPTANECGTTDGQALNLWFSDSQRKGFRASKFLGLKRSMRDK
jgi:hypothetical protein